MRHSVQASSVNGINGNDLEYGEADDPKVHSRPRVGGIKRWANGSSSTNTSTTATKPRLPPSRWPLIFSSLLLLAYALWTLASIPGLSLSSAFSFFGINNGINDKTLVIYIYSKTDKQYETNLHFFLHEGIHEDDGLEYLIVMQTGNGVFGDTDLPDNLPANVKVVHHENDCFDWGTFGWVVNSGIVDTSPYGYIIFLNSSVRGPFLPPYWPAGTHWSRAFIDRIDEQKKLVGATISCEGSWKGGVLTGEHRQNPHVQSYVVAMDQVGLSLLKSDPAVLQCYHKLHDAIWYAELGSSAAVLQAGYNIDSLMLRYQGVNWRDTSHWQCNGGLNPYAEWMYDGINLSPFEVIFVKVKDYLLQANWTAATAASKYSHWVSDHDDDIRLNEYTKKKKYLREVKVLGMRARGDACFDYDFYRERNPDLPAWGMKQLWEHFVKNGQHEGRQFRFDCVMTAGKPSLHDSEKEKEELAAAKNALPTSGGSSLVNNNNNNNSTTTSGGSGSGGSTSSPVVVKEEALPTTSTSNNVTSLLIGSGATTAKPLFKSSFDAEEEEGDNEEDEDEDEEEEEEDITTTITEKKEDGSTPTIITTTTLDESLELLDDNSIHQDHFSSLIGSDGGDILGGSEDDVGALDDNNNDEEDYDGEEEDDDGGEELLNYAKQSDSSSSSV